eukprot:CAMPEP_0119570924 /NCGR_PEP_ID=MMETSP1352-20130426/43862_1 /TAXON_ID=265584 /ORGANISM="Stauroneis constricta, Strain CCMP1120" /LENGTH=545 /DNA_ID=CAMNT_0007620601 /DNA_START=1 /DNA_END=1638 /DNA_ORIENTATION=+
MKRRSASSRSWVLPTVVAVTTSLFTIQAFVLYQLLSAGDSKGGGRNGQQASPSAGDPVAAGGNANVPASSSSTSMVNGILAATERSRTAMTSTDPHRSYAMAYHDSFGMIDNVDDEAWQRARQWARGFRQQPICAIIITQLLRLSPPTTTIETATMNVRGHKKTKTMMKRRSASSRSWVLPTVMAVTTSLFTIQAFVLYRLLSASNAKGGQRNDQLASPSAGDPVAAAGNANVLASSSSSTSMINGILAATERRTAMTSNEHDRSYGMAYHDSFGMIDNVDDEAWQRARQWARGFRQHTKNKPLSYIYLKEFWFYTHYDPYFSCPEQRRIGMVGDGPKWVCNMHRLKGIGERRWKEETAAAAQAQSSAAAASAYDPKKYGCLIYSIGSNGDYTFEDSVYDDIGGPECEIHIFDFSGDFDRASINPQRNMHFHKWGYQGSKDAPKEPFADLQTIVKRLGHEGRVIDLFKIDCEECEWSSYPDFVEYDNIRQVLIEVHHIKNTQLSVDFFDAFKNNNLVMYSKEVNPLGGATLEYSFIRMRPSFLGD